MNPKLKLGLALAAGGGGLFLVYRNYSASQAAASSQDLSQAGYQADPYAAYGGYGGYQGGGGGGTIATSNPSGGTPAGSTGAQPGDNQTALAQILSLLSAGNSAKNGTNTADTSATNPAKPPTDAAPTASDIDALISAVAHTSATVPAERMTAAESHQFSAATLLLNQFGLKTDAPGGVVALPTGTGSNLGNLVATSNDPRYAFPGTPVIGGGPVTSVGGGAVTPPASPAAAPPARVPFTTPFTPPGGARFPVRVRTL